MTEKEIIRLPSFKVERTEFDNSTHLQHLLKKQREKLGSTIEEIAERGGIANGMIETLEGGFAYGVTDSMVPRLSEAYLLSELTISGVIVEDLKDGHAVKFEDDRLALNGDINDESVQEKALE